MEMISSLLCNKENEIVHDLKHESYTRRQRSEITGNTLRKRSLELAKGNKFLFENNEWKPISYPGFSVVSMVSDNANGTSLMKWLIDIQNELSDRLDCQQKYYMLSSSSFHQTIANTFSARRYKKHVIDNNMEETFPAMVGEAFQNVQWQNKFGPLRLELIGLALFRTAIGIIADVPNKNDYEHILSVRDALYCDSALKEIGIRRTRPFIGHITLAYIERNLEGSEREHLVETIADMNSHIGSNYKEFPIQSLQLRRYENLSKFNWIPAYPQYNFNEMTSAG
jgi:hypothetical protein